MKKMLLFLIFMMMPSLGARAEDHTVSHVTTHAAAPQTDTFGLITEQQGFSSIVGVGRVHLGQAVTQGQELWVEEQGLTRLTDVFGNIYSVVGPAKVSFEGPAQMNVLLGNVKSQKHGMRPPVIETTFMNGRVEGEAALWVSLKEVQWFCLQGSLKTWHPELASVEVTVEPGFFTYMSLKERLLRPRRPQVADEEVAQAFLEKFQEPARIVKVAHAEHEATSQRAPTRTAQSKPLGSRRFQDAIEVADPMTRKRMQAHIKGEDFDEDEERRKITLVKVIDPVQEKLRALREKKIAKLRERENIYQKTVKEETADAKAVSQWREDSKIAPDVEDQEIARRLTQSDKTDRAPASKPSVKGRPHLEMTDVGDKVDEEDNGIISRIIKEKPKGASLE